MRAHVHVGAWTGFSVYSEADTSRPILHIEPTDRRQLIGLARDALDCDAIRFVKDGVEYQVQAGIPLAHQILKALYERG